MADNDDIKGAKEKDERKKGFLFYFFKILKTIAWVIGGFIGLIIILLISFVVLYQFEGPRHWFNSRALDIVNAGLEGKIEVADIYINPFSYVDVKGLRVLAAGDTVAYVYHAHITFNPGALLSSKALVYNAVLDSPRIKMLRSTRDSSWNITHISKPSVDTIAKKLNFTFDVRNLEIKNGFVLFIDSVRKLPKTDRVDFNNLFLRNLNTRLYALAEMGTGKFVADVKRMDVVERNSGMQVEKFLFHADMDSTYANLRDLYIQTQKTKLLINGKVDNINLLGALDKKALSKAKMSFNLKATPVSSYELKKFYDISTKLPDTVNLVIVASGNLDNAVLGDFRFRTGKSTLIIKGNAKNLLESNKLVYTALIDSSNVDQEELANFFPESSRKSIPAFGNLKLNDLYAEGSTKGIRVQLDANSGVGGIKGWARTNWAGMLDYAGDIKISDVRVDKIINNNKLSSSINGSIVFSGKGTSPKDINASVNLRSNNSRFTDYGFRQVALNANMNKGLLTIDTLAVVLNNPRTDSTGYLPPESSLYLSGRLDMTDMNMPRYEMIATASNINVAQIAQSASAPQLLSGNFKVMGEGFNPDSISTAVYANFTDLLFTNVYLLPFDMTLVLQRPDKETRNLSLKSKFMNASLDGKYNFSNLTGLIKTQAKYLTNFITDRINSVMPASYASSAVPVAESIEKFSPLDLHLRADVNDISPFAAFLNASVLNAKANLDINLNVTEDISTFKTDSFKISNFEMAIPQDSLNVKVNTLDMSALVKMGIKDHTPFLTDMDFKVKSDSDVIYNSLIIGKPFVNLAVSNDSTLIAASTSINNIADISTKGSLQFNPGNLNVLLDSLNLTYNKTMTWSAVRPVDVVLNQEEINIRAFDLARKNAEKIAISGTFDKQNIHNASIVVTDYPLAGINQFLPPEKQEFLESIKGRIDTLAIGLNGSTQSPVIDVHLKSSPITINDIPGGVLAADFHHENAVVKGDLSVLSMDTLSNRKLLDLTVNLLPLDLGMNGTSQRLHNRVPLDARLQGDSIPLVLASPFSAGVENLSGYLNADVTLGGQLPKNLTYNGTLKLLNAKYLLEATNINYIANGDIKVSNDQVAIDNLVLRNVDDDLPGGKAVINGNIQMKDYNITGMDINLQTGGFMLLSEASQRSMPTLYGNLVISTGPQPLKFTGSPKEPSISGDINIVKADLAMGTAPGTENVKSNVIYEIGGKPTYFSADTSFKDVAVGDSAQIKYNTSAPTVSAPDAEPASRPLVYDLGIKIEDRINLTMDIGPVGSLKAIIGTPDPNVPVHLTPGRYGSTPIVSGGLVVMEGSSLDFIFNRDFKTHGTITFPTGQVDNPALDLTAEYNGQSNVGGQMQNYTVYLYITGTKESPQIKFDYMIDNEKAIGDQKEIEDDAMSLILFGKTHKDLLSGQGSQGGGLSASDISTAYYSQLSSTFSSGASQIASALARQTKYIQSASVDIGSGKWEEAKLNLSGEIFGGVRLTVGGTIADLYNNNEVTVEYRLPVVIDKDWLNNVLLQATRSVNNNQTIITRNQKEWEIKVKLGGSW